MAIFYENNTVETVASFWAVTFNLYSRKMALAVMWKANGRCWRPELGGEDGVINTRGSDLQKYCQNRKMLCTLTKLSSSLTFLFVCLFFQLKILLAWLVFPNSQSSPEVSQYGFIVSWGILNFWKIPFVFWIYGKHLNCGGSWRVLRNTVFWFSQ